MQASKYWPSRPTCSAHARRSSSLLGNRQSSIRLPQFSVQLAAVIDPFTHPLLQVTLISADFAFPFALSSAFPGSALPVPLHRFPHRFAVSTCLSGDLTNGDPFAI